MWESILLTVAATAGNNIGKVLQKKGTVILPPLSFKLKVIRTYASNKPWLIGFLMDIFGALLMLWALSLAPFCTGLFFLMALEPTLILGPFLLNQTLQLYIRVDARRVRNNISSNVGDIYVAAVPCGFGRAIGNKVSVIQPVSGIGLAILSIFSHFYLKEVMNVVDWMGITLAGIGTIGVGAGGEEQKVSSISIFHLPWLACAVAFLFVLLNGWLRIYRRQRREQELRKLSMAWNLAFCLGTFLMASVISKMGFVFLEQGFPKLLVPLCISISICCSASGFVYQTRGLKHGRAVVVSTCAAVASIVSGVLAGMFALGEKLPSAPKARLWLLLGWVLIVTGVILLVSSTRLISYLPRSWRCFVVQGGVDRNLGLRQSGSIRTRDPSPTTVIQATTLHHLMSNPSNEKV